jgi:hypothetical protein
MRYRALVFKCLHVRAAIGCRDGRLQGYLLKAPQNLL